MANITLRKPKPLTPGDCVAVCAPSSPVPQDVMKTSIESVEFLGLKPLIMPSCTMSHGYLAGDDHQRAGDINDAFANDNVKGIFCLRGGFGASRTLPLLDLPLITENPKVFVGYSDITALHLAFNKLCGFITYHGPMPTTGYATMDDFSLTSLKNCIFDTDTCPVLINPEGEKMEAINGGTCEGRITGGNLSLLTGTLGSPYEVDAVDKILFIEDVGERPYRLDKALTALALAGKFKACAGIILGTFAECEEPPADTVPKNTNIAKDSLTLNEIFDEVIKPFDKPTIVNFRAGHIYPQSTIPMGAHVSMDADRLTLKF